MIRLTLTEEEWQALRVFAATQNISQQALAELAVRQYLGL